MASSIDSTEIHKFSLNTHQWWNEQGPYRLLHQINPARLQYLQSQLIKKGMLKAEQPEAEQPRTKRKKDKHTVNTIRSTSTAFSSSTNFNPYQHLSILDIGCGGGLICEPLARLGASVTGIDAVEDNIRAASLHAEQANLSIQYQWSTAEDWAAKSNQYDVVIVFELIEHINDPQAFLTNCLQLLKQDGLLVLSTLNRTIKSYLLSIVAAEYLLRWVPRGTHEWQKFLKPSEIAQILTDQGCTLHDISGLEYILWKDQWRLTSSNEVNYFLTASK